MSKIDTRIGIFAGVIGLSLMIVPVFFVPTIADPSTVGDACERIPLPLSEMEPAVLREFVKCPYGYRPKSLTLQSR